MKVTVVLPAYQAAATLRQTVEDIPTDAVDEIIIIDDGSHDRTFALAEELANSNPRLTPSGRPSVPGRVPVVCDQLNINSGYGANQKRCYELARVRGADIVVMLHPDQQYDARSIPRLVTRLHEGQFDIVLGSRIRSLREARESGMPLYKYAANRLLSAIQNRATGQRLSEWHTGLRAYRTPVLADVGYERFSNDFLFDSQMLLHALARGYRIGEIPTRTRYHRDASSITFWPALRYGLQTLWEVARYARGRTRYARGLV